MNVTSTQSFAPSFRYSAPIAVPVRAAAPAPTRAARPMPSIWDVFSSLWEDLVRATLLSDNGGGVVSNNGGGIISNNCAN